SSACNASSCEPASTSSPPGAASTSSIAAGAPVSGASSAARPSLSSTIFPCSAVLLILRRRCKRGTIPACRSGTYLGLNAGNEPVPQLPDRRRTIRLVQQLVVVSRINPDGHVIGGQRSGEGQCPLRIHDAVRVRHHDQERRPDPVDTPLHRSHRHRRLREETRRDPVVHERV